MDYQGVGMDEPTLSINKLGMKLNEAEDGKGLIG
jgi:hypothetical protein